MTRLYLIWMFRNFPNLPAEVLGKRQKALIDRLCSEQRFVSRLQTNPLEDSPILGTVESRPMAPLGMAMERKPNTSIGERSTPFAAEGQNRS